MTRRPPARSRRARLAGTLARMPAAALACALVAFLNAVAWSLVVPPFQVPDEQAHYAYTEYLAQHSRPPVPAPIDVYSDAQTLALAAVRFDEMQFVRGNGALWSPEEQRRMEHDVSLPADTTNGNGAAHTVGAEPPLFYALQAIPYRLAEGGTVLDRLVLMRVLSALLGGVAVLFVFLFLREALPGHPWSWTVGALGVAFQPLFAFITSGVNSDALLYPASAAVFFLLARAFRRGLTLPLALAIGGAIAVGLLTKFNPLGLVPGVAVGMLLIAVRQEGQLRLRTLRLPIIALAVGAAPTLLEIALNPIVWDRPSIGASASAFAIRDDIRPTPQGLFEYIFQFYLVPLPGTVHPIGDTPFWESWFQGFVGLFGWVDTEFRPWVYTVATAPLGAVVVLAARTLAMHRRTVRRRRLELFVYALTGVTFALFVATASYIVYVRFNQSVAQVRYLFPLLALYAGLLALAVQGAGRRWAPVVGGTIVVLAIAHNVFSQLLLVSRYYA